ncbi:MAG: hypothetical protein AB7F35_17010 [Acetobacteraceae bacterium]
MIVPELEFILAGLVGLAAWEAVARLVAPLWIGGVLDPSGLVQAALGVESEALAMAVHVATAVLLFPLGWLLVGRPILRLLGPAFTGIFGGLAYGVGLWVFAMVVVVHFLAGMPPFLEWQPLAWVSLLGHVAYGAAMTGVLAWFRDAT